MLKEARPEMRDMSDSDLVKKAQDGDVAAVGVLYDRHQPIIYRYVRLRVGHDRQAEDLTGEIFTRMLTSLPRYRATKKPFRAWLYRVAHNLIVDHYRRQNGRMTVPLHFAEGLSETMNNPDMLVDQRMTLERIEKALDLIDPIQKEVVVLRFLVGLPLKEVADTLDKTVAAVKSLQHRGLAALRVQLRQEVVS
jgi:RNA polymerase sigma-70 factor (ECF subfamily)